MRSKFAIAKHPLHPALVALPIGLFAWAFICDLVYLGGGSDDATWYDMAYWSGIAGIISALVAALPGFGDYLTMAVKTPARGMATAHMILNLTVVALYSIAAIMMFDDGATNGGALTTVIVLHALGMGLLALSGWLGGEMVFRYHLAVIPDEEMRAEGTLPSERLRPAQRARR